MSFLFLQNFRKHAVYIMSLIRSRFNQRKYVIYNILLLFMSIELFVYVDALPLVEHQFQCVTATGYDLCMFPKQYCHTGTYHSECRPCSKDICDKLNDANFTHQCSYNCSIGIENIREPSSQGFITENANVWFILLLIFLVCLVCTIPCWKPKSRSSNSRSSLQAEIEKLTLVEKRQDDELSMEKINTEDNELTENVPISGEDENATSYPYCQQRLQNVNPTDTDDVEDTKNRVVTARDTLGDEITKAKQLRDDITPLSRQA